MPGALTATLSAPLHRLLELVGPGQTAEPAAALARLQQQLGVAAQATAGHTERVLSAWAGAAAMSATEHLDGAVARARRLADRIGALGDSVGAAAQAVGRARAELERLIADFEARGNALEARLDAPGAAEELIGEARRALADALRLIEDLRAELATGAGNVTAGPPATTSPAGPSAPATGLGSGVAPGLAAGLGSAPAMGSAPQIAEAAFAARRADLPDAAQFGVGEAVQLPDGSTAMAPNAVAASAVRHALTQLGVPYQWGGTTAGVGLDCSGLTQWAYREAGLNIPRLAQEQDIGAAVDAGALRPGDLAVWDGHVAMVVGDGLMVEAGDPVQLSAIRTTNAGQGFQGFWRPTA